MPRDPEPLPRRIFSIHPPWWARGFTLLVLAALLWLFFVPASAVQRGWVLFHVVPAQPSGWRIADTPSDPAAIAVRVDIETEQAFLWARYSAGIGPPFSWNNAMASLADLPFADEVAASAWLAAEAQGAPFGFQREGRLPRPAVLRDLFRSVSQGRREHIANRWAYAASFTLRPGAWILATFAVLLGIARLARRLWLERRVRIIDAGLCIHCRYNLEGVPATAACPECGRLTHPVLRQALDELGMHNQA